MTIPGNTILLGVGGSHAHGLAHEGSDYDYRGVFSLPTDEFFKVNSTPAEHFVTTSDEADYSVYELAKYLRLVTKGNPDAIELLAIDTFVDMDMEWGPRLLELAPSLLGHAKMKGSYLGYASQQFKAASSRMVTYAHDLNNETVSNLSAVEIARLLRERQLSEGREESLVSDVSSGESTLGAGERPHEKQSSGEPVRGEEPRSTGRVLPASELRDNTGSVRRDAGQPGREVPDLLGTRDGGGSLPLHGRDSRSSLSEVQQGSRSLRGLGSSSAEGDLVLVRKLKLWKEMKHMFRLLESYEKFARTGVLNPKVDDKYFYTAILPSLSLEQIIDRFEIDLARVEQVEPVGRALPDIEAANRYLIDYRRAH